MADVHSLAAELKERAGKGAARAVRRGGRVPAVIYGAKKDPVMISLDPRDVSREVNSGGFFATLFDIQVGKSKERVLPRDLQLHPVTDQPLHIDFLRVSAATEVTVEVPCVFINEEESPGLKRGGVLNVVRYEVEVVCRADAIPQQIEIDLTGLEIGDGVHISNVNLPDGVSPSITDRDFTIATVAAPTVVQEEEAEGEEGEAVEGEVPAAEGEEPAEPAAEESGGEG
ncbi:MAG: 50S ribosomal protein L25/general stress protein Ctc [Kiloniellales bacterium]|nr:50S ribosomal protein L25/general stress protein Ctc [Kiloniellales bacterium]